MSAPTLAPLKHRPFRFLLAGRTINALGNAFAPIALAFAVLDLTGSATDLGLVVGARTVVNVAFLLFGGVLADRLPKTALMVGSSLAAALTQGLVAALVLSHNATIPLLIGLAAVNGMVAALALPASASLLPLTVPADIRQQANAIGRLALNSAAILGAPAAGIVVAAVGPGWGIAVDAATFVLSAVFFGGLGLVFKAAAPGPGRAEPAAISGEAVVEEAVSGLPSEDFGLSAAATSVPEKAAGPPQKRPNIFVDLRTGWSEFRSRTWLWAVVAGFGVLNMAWAGGLFVLGPVIADESIGRRAWGFVLAAQTAGMILGGLLAIRLRLTRLLYFGVASCGLLALPVFVLGIHPSFWLLVITAVVAGAGVEQFGVAWETTMQEHVPADKLARVYSYDMVGSFVAMPIGEMAIGPISHVIGAEATLIGAGSLMVIAILAQLSSRDIRTLRHKLPEPENESVKESVA
ncbi:MFS transporter [Paractinoplanes durhamensis]|uniref:MFS transporter n=1 Tax=Paractinoplanes durhamensis TaxID=113563 RepID=A0ABQ3ZCA4_9ACTN|nr:MFS transporter [Actinoplanes durhamensis]GIE07458.1 MFS transporter [Actinoplanes durhamensis]